MKKLSFSPIYGFLLCVLYAVTGTSLDALAQTPPGWAWAKRIGAFSNQTGEENHGRGIGTDAAGNVYMLGEFTGTITLDGLSAASAGETDIFLAKYSPAGNLVWLRQLSSPSLENAGRLVVDAAGNCTLIGSYGLLGGHDLTLPDGQVLVGPVNAGVAPTVGTIYGRFSFAASFNTLGDVRWATRFTTSYTITPSYLALDDQGNAYVSGSMRGSVVIAGQTYPVLGTSDGFLMKLSGTGQIQWFRQAGAAGAECTGGQVAIDNANASYWSYYANQPIQIGTTAGYASIAINGNPIVKISASNRLLWIRSLSTTNIVGGVSLAGIDRTTNTVTAYGTVWNGAVITFNGYPNPITGPTGTTYGLLVAMADTAGQVTWARQLGTTPVMNRSNWAQIQGLVRNSRQELVMTLEMNSSLTIPGYGTVAPPQNGMLVLEYNPTTNTVRSARLADMSTSSYGNHAGTVVDAQDNILVGGSFMGTARFGATTLTSTISARRDAFFAKLDQTVLSNRKAAAGLRWSVYPNPAHRFITVSDLPVGAQLRLTDAQGRSVRVFSPQATALGYLPLTSLAPGLYLVQVEATKAAYAPQKLVVE